MSLDPDAAAAPQGRPEVVPVLKHADWPGHATCACRVLAEAGEARLPWVAFGLDHPDRFEFVLAADLEAQGRSLEQLEAEALASLRGRPAGWEPTEVVASDAGTLRVLVCTGEAERILDAGLMTEAQQILGCELLAVGVPRRGLLLCTDAGQPEELLRHFAVTVSSQFQRQQTAPISPLVLAMANGRIVGVLGGEEPLTAEAPVFVERMLVADPASGLHQVMICAGGPGSRALLLAMESALQEALQSQLPEPGFEGTVRFLVLLQLTPRTPGLEEQLERLAARLRHQIDEAGLTTVSGRAVSVELDWAEG